MSSPPAMARGPSIAAGLAADVQRDLRTIWRNGFFVAVLVITALHIAVLKWLGDFLQPWMVALTLIEVFTFNGFFLAGVLLLMDRAERSLLALSLTPLAAGRWLVSRCLVLTALAWLECLAICLLLWPEGLVAALASAAVATPLLALLGVAFTARYRGFSEFLMPSVALFLIVMLPLLRLGGISESEAFWLHPLTPAVELLMLADAPATAGRWLMALAAGALWVLVMYRLTRHVCHGRLGWH